MSYLKDREIWLSNVPTGNPPAGYFWKFIQNGKVVVRDSSGNNQIMVATSGSQAITGSLIVTGGITGTISSASYVQYSNVANKPALVSGSSQVTFLGLSSIPSGIVSGSSQVAQFGYATTGSNGFNGSQSITGSLTVTGQVIAQTLNVQQVTSSIVYSSGSNIFGSELGNTQTFTGSMFITGSNLNANVGNACFQGSVCSTTALATHIISNSTLSVAGNCSSAICLIKDYSGTPGNPGLVIYNTAGNLTFQHNSNGGSTITGGNLLVSGVGCFSGALCSPTGLFSGCVGIGTLSPGAPLELYRDAGTADTTGGGVIFSRYQLGGDYRGSAIFHRYITAGGSNDSMVFTVSEGCNPYISSTTALDSRVKMIINVAGNVGIGTISPCARLQVGNGTQAGINGASNKIHIATTGTRSALLTLANSSGGTTVEGQFESSAESADLRVIIGSTSNHPLVFRTNNSEVIRILSSGNVGIGETNPNAPLHVKNLSNGFIQRFTGGTSGTITGGIFAEIGRDFSSIGTTSNHGFRLFTNDLDRLVITNCGNVGIGCVSPGVSLTIGGTDAIKIPVGTTAQRPSPSTGMVRFNSSCTELEFYNGSEWLFFEAKPVTQGYYADVLVVAGGGGGGGAEASNGFGGGGAGGGAGGYIAGRIFIDYTIQSYPITIGAGGAGGVSHAQSTGSGCNGVQGGASCALGFVAIGGGFGGGDETGTGGGNGGSGGGTGGDNSGVCGRGVLGQGCIGGANNTRLGGGGGGAGFPGCTGFVGSGAGGNGRIWLNGSTYAGGGGGGAGSAVQTTQSGGTGGGGNGSSTNGTAGDFQPGGTATPGTANTGGGGGAAAAGRAQGGQNGGSGIVIIRYLGPQIGFGGTITSSGGYTYHAFTTSGTYCATYFV